MGFFRPPPWEAPPPAPHHPRGHDTHGGHVPDIVTPTETERRAADLHERERRYFTVMIPCIVLTVLGFFVLPWTPARLGVLAVAAVLPPIAAIVANPVRRR
jgi:hypothetical protein